MKEKELEVKILDRGPNHKLVKIYVKGRVYAATYAEPFPSEETARKHYLANPKSFRPFDESGGTYL